MIEMQYKKVFKGYEKSTFVPLVAGTSNLGLASTSEVRRNSFRHRRVAPEPLGNSDSESAMSYLPKKNRECMYADESISFPTEILNKEPTESMTEVQSRSGSSLWNVAPSTSQVELFSRSVSPAPTTDHRDEDVVSPVDHQRFTTRVAWRGDGEGLSEGEQSEGQIEEDQSEV